VPILVFLGLAITAILWSQQVHSTLASTAAELMREFKANPRTALLKYRGRQIVFTGKLMKPDWVEELVSDVRGGEAIIYFATDGPEDWISAIIPFHRGRRRDLEEGQLYLISGEVMGFDEDHVVFLYNCRILKRQEPPKPEGAEARP